MNTLLLIRRQNQKGSALMLTMIMSAVALAILAGAMTWASSSSRLTHRSIQHTRSIAAAEAATEKVVGQITHDFLFGTESLVVNNLNFYRQSTVPSPADSAYWNGWQFNDGNGNIGQTYVERTPGSNYVVLDSTYAGLKGYVTTYTVVSHARDTISSQDVTGGVLQELKLTGIPIFQFMMYSTSDMEISCGQPFDITGRVHSNGHLYVEPDSSMTFESGVTAVLDILFQRNPLDPRGLVPNGGVVYVHPEEKIAPVPAMTLPIGTTNTPEAIREIIQPSPAGEDPTSAIARLRYNNLCDMVLVITNNGMIGSSGGFNNFTTPIPTNELALFVSTGASFWDAREGKWVQPIDLNIGVLKTWSETNSNLRLALIAANYSNSLYIMDSLYVIDRRTSLTLPDANLGAVRVFNGSQLLTNGLTVATARPLYVWGHYNQLDSAKLGTADTSTTRPASLVADAITVLSQAWQDNHTGPGVAPAGAAPTTVNAAFLTGVVETTPQHYSGGMENFPRFLENWGAANQFNYNGSMVKMFPSLFATNVWGQPNVYNPPQRAWTYDVNFDDSTKLPPKTPQLQKMIRGKWATVAPDSNVAATMP